MSNASVGVASVGVAYEILKKITQKPAWSTGKGYDTVRGFGRGGGGDAATVCGLK